MMSKCQCQLFILLLVYHGSVSDITTEVVYAVLGKAFVLTYASQSNRSIDYCQWTKINSTSEAPSSLITPEPLHACTVIIQVASLPHFGIWQCIVVFTSNVEEREVYETHYVDVIEAQKPSSPKLINKNELQTVVANSASPGKNNNTLNLKCCIQDGLPPPKLSLYFDNQLMLEGLSDGSHFCVSWEGTFEATDDEKLISCRAVQMGIEEADEFQLKVLYPPTLIKKNEIKSYILSEVSHPNESIFFSYQFISNPDAKVQLWWVTEQNRRIVIENTTNSEESFFLNVFQDGTREVTFVIRYQNFFCLKKDYHLELFNKFGSTAIDFTVKQIVRVKSEKLQHSPQPKIVNVSVSDFFPVSCCVLQLAGSTPDIIKINLRKDGVILDDGSINLKEDSSSFCITWTHIKPSFDDHGKVLSCESDADAQLSMKIEDLGISDSLKLNVLSPPMVTGNTVYADADAKLFLESRLDTSLPEFRMTFSANPRPSVVNLSLLENKTREYKRVHLDTSLAEIEHEGNIGTVIFKPDAWVDFSNKTPYPKFVCLLLKNEKGKMEVCFHLKNPKTPELLLTEAAATDLITQQLIPATVAMPLPSTLSILTSTEISKAEASSDATNPVEVSMSSLPMVSTEILTSEKGEQAAIQAAAKTTTDDFFGDFPEDVTLKSVVLLTSTESSNLRESIDSVKQKSIHQGSVARNILIPSAVAGLLLVVVAILYIIKDNSWCISGRRKSWPVRNEVRLTDAFP